MSENRSDTFEPNSGQNREQPALRSRDVAARLSVSRATLNTWLKDDEERAAEERYFQFHRWVGNRRIWSEQGYARLELAIHAQSENGVLSPARSRVSTSPADPDADSALAEIFGAGLTRTL